MYNVILRTLLLLSLTAFLLYCNTPKENGMDPARYSEYISEWDSERLESLKSPGGWLNLAGLFWLEEGENSVGSDAGNDIIFPRGPARVGDLIQEGDIVRFRPYGETNVKADGTQLSGTTAIYGEGTDARLLTVDSLAFFIIRRGERSAVRLRDYMSYRLELEKIERFRPDQRWIIRARFIESEQELTIRIPDVLGGISEEKAPGILEFEFDGETYRLYPTGSRDRLFIIFADDTNALETYGGGRFLVAGGPDDDGYVYMDFNKAYNPPCALTPYATCPLPPRENFLPFRVEAGEKSVQY